MSTVYSDAVKRAEKVLDEFWKKNGIVTVPVDVIGIARSYNINVYAATFNSKYSDTLYGMIRGKDGKFDIFVNAKNSLQRQRFSIAHELGHFFLHHDSDKASELEFVDLRSDLSSPKEVEANKFATALLMPECEIRKQHGKLLFPTADELAKTFNVSKPAMQIRLRELNLDALDA